MATVLLVDDQQEVLRLFSRGLEVAGYHVRTADSVEAATRVDRPDPRHRRLVAKK